MDSDPELKLASVVLTLKSLLMTDFNQTVPPETSTTDIRCAVDLGLFE